MNTPRFHFISSLVFLLLSTLVGAGAIPRAELFQLQPAQVAPSAAPTATSLRLDREALSALLAQNPEELVLRLPRREASDWQLVLARHELRSTNFRLTGPGNVDLDAAKPLHFRGYVAGRPDAAVALTLSAGGVMAVVLTPEGSHVLGPRGGKPLGETEYFFYLDQQLTRRPQGTRCATRDDGTDWRKTEPTNTMADPCRYLTQYLECTYSLYTELHANADAVVAYVEALYNVVAMLLDREEISSQIDEIFIWTVRDPYPPFLLSVIDVFEQMNPLAQRPETTLGHLLRYLPGGGGIARDFAVLCEPTNRRLAYTSLALAYDELPFYSEDVLIMTHEIGHNLGSRHTHSCIWPGGAIDGCAPVETDVGLCDQPPYPRPPFQGTIMSYCSFVPGVGVNLNLGFGPLPGARIREHLAESACLPVQECDCHAPRVPLIVERPSPTEAVVQWIAMPRAVGYEVEYRRRNDPAFGPALQTTEPRIRLTGLQPDTDYEIRVRTRCSPSAGVSQSRWSRIFRGDSLRTQFPPYCDWNQSIFGFEGRLTDGSPANMPYANRSECSWFIFNYSGSPIEVQFTRFATEAGRDWVTIYDGPDQSGRLLGQFSGQELPPTLLGLSGGIFIVFTSDSSGTDLGWELYYRTRQDTTNGTCQPLAVLNEEASFFSDGSRPNLEYGHNLECHWQIAPISGLPLRIEFTRFATELGSDFVSIYDGFNTDAPLLGRYSGNELPPPLIVPGGAALVVFQTDSANADTGWEIYYHTLSDSSFTCGGTTYLLEPEGRFSDGSLPDEPYSNLLSCSWLIEPMLGLPLEIRFTRFATEQGYDWVTIYDGSSPGAPMLGTFSGTELPPTLIAYSGSAFVRFQTDGSVTNTGWEIEYRTLGLEGTCRGQVELSEPSGRFSDGSHPDSLYDNDRDCRWLISPGLGLPIEIRFIRFATEDQADFVWVYDGPSDDSPLLGKFSGAQLPPHLIAQSGWAYVVFQSNESLGDTGWEIEYRVLEDDSLVSCSGLTVLNDEFGFIDDGSGPDRLYSNNLDCRWLIDPGIDGAIDLIFQYFSTEIEHDILYVYDGADESAPLIGAYSGFQNDLWLVAYSGKAYLVFQTNDRGREYGWELNYRPVGMNDRSCRGRRVLRRPSGTFTDGSAEDARYSNNLNCEWLIAPPNARELSLVFDRFATQPETDVVEIYNGDEAAPNQLLGRFSGRELPPPVVASSGKAFIRFRTDASVTDLGWQLSYSPAPTSRLTTATPTALRLIPNPTSGRVELILHNDASGAARLRVYDVQGRCVLSEPVDLVKGPQAVSFDATEWAAGLYTVVLEAGHAVRTGRLVRN